MSFVVVENLNSARKKTEVTSKPCSLVSLSSAWLMLPNSPSPPVDQLLLLSLPLKLLPASHISPPMPTPYKKPKTCLLTFQKISLKKAPDRTFLGEDRRQHGSYYHSLARLSSSLVKGWWLFWRNSGGGGQTVYNPHAVGLATEFCKWTFFGNGKWDQLRHMIKNMHGAFVFTKCLASQSPAFWHCALGWRISLSGPEIPATHKGKILDLFRTNFGFFPDL